MTERTPSPWFTKDFSASDRRKTLMLRTKVSMICAGAVVVATLLLVLCLYLNGWLLQVYGTGPHPLAGYASMALFMLGIPVGGIALLVCFVSTVTAPFNRPRFANFAASIFSFAAVFVCGSVFATTLNIAKQSSMSSDARSLGWVGYELTRYCSAGDGTIPAADHWWRSLNEGDFSASSFLTSVDEGLPEGTSCYALNEHVAGLPLADIPSDVVLIFETAPSLNLAGGPEVAVARQRDGKGCLVLFADMHVGYVDIHAIRQLRWEP